MSQTGNHVRNRHATGPDGQALTRETHGPPGFGPSIEGVSYADVRSGEQSQLADIAPNAIDGGRHIVPNSLSLDLFAEEIRPPIVVDALPSLPDDEYPQGSLVFYTADEKLYRNTDGSTWSVEVDGGDILATSITAGKIAVGAIGADQIAANAITTEKFHVGAKAPNVENSTAEVLIDSTGITILNGKISLQDYGGSSVLNAAGFSGSWVDFIAHRVYNSYFASGPTIPGIPGYVTISSTSEVGTGSTVADYEAGLSDELPYWVISDIIGSVQLFTDPVAPAQRAVKIASSTSGFEVYQDIPVVAGHSYVGVLNWRYNIGATATVDRTLSYSWRDSDHAIIGTEASSGLSYTNTSSSSTYYHEPLDLKGGEVAPAGARFLRVKVKFEQVAGPSAFVAFGGLRANEETHIGPISLLTPNSGDDMLEIWLRGESYPRLLVIGSGQMTWGDGSGAGDTQLLRASANVLTTGTGDRFDTVFPARKLTRSSNLTVANSSWTKIGNPATWGTEFFDTMPGTVSFTGSTDASLRVNVAGRYLVFGTVYWDTNTTGGRIAGFSEGTSSSPPNATASSSVLRQIVAPVAAGGVGTTQMFSAVREYAVNDEVSLCVYQDSGTARTIHTATFGMIRLGTV